MDTNSENQQTKNSSFDEEECDLNLITQQIYLGGSKAALNADCLKHFGITHIIDMMNLYSQEESKTNQEIQEQPIEQNNKQKSILGRGLFEDQFTYLVFADVQDTRGQDIEQHFDRCHEFVRGAIAQGGKIYVHCQHGKSRSAAIVISFLMQEYGMTLEQAAVYVRQRRFKAQPNPGFMQQLVFFQKMLSKHRKIKELPMVEQPEKTKGMEITIQMPEENVYDCGF